MVVITKIRGQCDENRPGCVNCVTGGLQCAFLREEKAKPSRPRAGGLRSPALSGFGTSTHTNGRDVDGGGRIQVPSPLPPATFPSTTFRHDRIAATDPDLNLDHLEFIHHWCTMTYRTMTPDPAQQEIWQTTVIKLGLSSPFLMHIILAIASLHLAHCHPEKQSYYCSRSTELQSRALSGFNVIQNQVDASNCAAVLLFVSLLAFHVLADPLRSRGLSFSDYLDHFLRCLDLMRGVRPVVITDWWPYLSESELKPLLHVQQPEEPYNIPDQCRELAHITQATDMGSATIRTYDEAIHCLHWAFAASEGQNQNTATIRWLLAWPALLEDSYLKLLRERRPEALVILAYYGVLLHFHRASWAVGDTGGLLIKAINAHTGPFWERWMAWPNQLIGATG